MYFKYLATAIVWACISFPVKATPILSSDGSKITNLDVEGALYDVTFQDGVYGDIFAGIDFSAPGYTTLVGNISSGIASFLTTVSTLPEDIAGCGSLSNSIYCLIFLPSRTFTNSIGIVYQADPDIRGYSDGAWVYPSPSAAFNQLADSTVQETITLATFEKAQQEVPAPGTLFLLGLGLAYLVWLRRRKAESVLLK